MTSTITRPRIIRIFQFYQVIARFMVLLELFMSREREAIVSVFLTRRSIFSSRCSSFCRSSLRMLLTSSVSFHNFATLSTYSGELYSSIFPLSLLAKSIAPYIFISLTFSGA